jgi:hypothetical protein
VDSEVASIVAFYCEIMLGDAHPGLGLACSEHLDQRRLDYSLESLRAVDVYLLQVHRNLRNRPVAELATTVMSVGSYVGEVVRRATPQTQCQWARSVDAPPNLVADGVSLTDIGELVLLWGTDDAAVIPTDTVMQRIRYGSLADSIHDFAMAAMKLARAVPDT